jgi:hypothetical protein
MRVLANLKNWESPCWGHCWGWLATILRSSFNCSQPLLKDNDGAVCLAKYTQDVMLHLFPRFFVLLFTFWLPHIFHLSRKIDPYMFVRRKGWMVSSSIAVLSWRCTYLWGSFSLLANWVNWGHLNNKRWWQVNPKTIPVGIIFLTS